MSHALSTETRRSAPPRLLGRASQRERLTQVMIELAARDGYQNISVAQLSAEAAVSSATFYAVFDDKEACGLEAYRSAVQRVLRRMEPVDSLSLATTQQWSHAAGAALRRLFEAVRDEPAAARLLFVEALASGPRVRDERRLVTVIFQRRAEALLASTPDGSSRLDLPPAALVGAVRSIVARHLRMSAEDQLPSLADELVAWIASYAVAPTRALWSTGPQARLRRTDLSHAHRPGPPKRLPRGRHRLPPSVVARSHRTRLIHAVAQVTYEKGYAHTTIADIVAAAGVARQVFYEHFTDKEHAFLEAQQYPAQHIFDECAAAYFAPSDWTERIWSGLRALLGLVVEHPALSHLRLVECYAAGPAAARRAEEVTRSFTIFFEEGFAFKPAERELPHLATQAVAGAIFEIIQRHAVREDLEALPLMLPQLTYIATAPFVGAEHAIHTVRELAAAAGYPTGKMPHHSELG
jgi:AcrR family transcriptional regulator